MSSLRAKAKGRRPEEIHTEESSSSHLNNPSGGTPHHPSSPGSSSPKDPLDDIVSLSLEDTEVEKKSSKSSKSSSSSSKKSKSNSKRSKTGKRVTGGPSSGDSIFTSQGASGDIVRSGHLEFQSMYASNDCGITGPVTVNVVNAPNNSTMQCGCENINCPFCNLMLSIEKTDPTVLQ
ncbi:Uncharacterized protein FKW44_022342 [Caligus rogercresseyi]|uniref:Uncharacterized protein n=1 Tax=Caligus rogercresseyi TaxID=217165 RepID=A0A7T8JVS0_CALRO|nr:Uncharacterized protein FKW44_022342 [Caligus rogercresseyi]